MDGEDISEFASMLRKMRKKRRIIAMGDREPEQSDDKQGEKK